MGRKHGPTGVRYGTPITEFGRAMRDDQARAALLLIEALERCEWRITRAAVLLGYRDYGVVDDAVRKLGLRSLVRSKRREVAGGIASWPHVRAVPLLELLHVCGDRQSARALVLSALHARKGNVLRAAQDLGVSESGLRHQVRSLGVRNELNAIRRSYDGNPKARAQWRAMLRRKEAMRGRA